MKRSRIKLLLIISIALLYAILEIINLNKNTKNKKAIFLPKLENISKMEKKLNLSFEFIKIYSIMYYAANLGLTKRPKVSLKKRVPNHKTHKKGIGICAVCKKENLYAKEFIEYYMKLGIKKIIIYDNNEINGENFEDILKEYIINGNVEIIDIRGFESVQNPAYTDCYKKYGEQFDFLSFLDFDEFIKIENNLDINKYLYNKKFDKCETIILNWVIYGDNNLVKYDNRTMIERFTKPILKSRFGKSIVRTNISNLIFSTVHTIGINTQYFCDSNGNRLFPNSFYRFKVPNRPEAYIKHFYTKTAEEFCNKINRGIANCQKFHPSYLNRFNLSIKLFFYYNLITREKLEIIENCTKMNLTNYRKKMKKF